MAFTSILVTGGPYETPDGSVATGEVRFRLTASMRLGVVEITDNPVVAHLDATGSISQRLFANDDVGVEPPNTAYAVTVALDGAEPEVRYVRIPHAAAGGTVDLSAL